MNALQGWLPTAALSIAVLTATACFEQTAEKSAEDPRDDEPELTSSGEADVTASVPPGASRLAPVDPPEARLSDELAFAEPALPIDRITPRFQTALSRQDDFYRMPWPSNYRLASDGRVDLSDFPNRGLPVVDTFLETVETELNGFSLMPVVYLALDGAPDDLIVPTPVETVGPGSPVQLIELTASNCGARTPLEMVFSTEADVYRPERLLSVTPVLGFPLAPDTTYALVILDRFGAPNDFVSTASAEMAALLDGSHPDARLNEVYEPLWGCLDQLAFEREAIAVATVFSTDDPVSESRRLRAMVTDPTRVPSPVISGWQRIEDDEAAYVSYRGTYQTPIFQRGESPYTSVGGGFVFDDRGEPVIQRWEAVPFVVSWPKTEEASYPLMVFQDGTGAGLTRHLRRDFSAEAFAIGFAIASFAPQFHADRAVEGSDPVIHSFNYLNPESGRTVFRQQAVDTSYFVRVLREALPEVLEGPALDTERLVYGGHSQGALVGALVAGLEDQFVAYYLNGVGSYISETIVGRKDPIDIAATLASFAQIDGEVTALHPLVQMTQLGADAVDGHSYARYWAGWEGSPGGSHVFTTNGLNDHTTPHELINHLTITGDLAPVAPVGWDVDPNGLWWRDAESLPILGNRRSLDGSFLTMASYLNAETGHHTLSDDAVARRLAVEFLWTALSGAPYLGAD